MSDHTHIEWTDATWNPITGCSIVSPGCTNCYAMRLTGTRLRHHPSRAGLTREVNGHHVWTGNVRLNEQWLTQPLRWTQPRRIFVCAHGDLFHESVPDAWIDRVFAVMAICDRHTFQVLTKRSARMRAYLSDPAMPARVAAWGGRMMADGDTWLSVLSKQHVWNVWLGVSAEDQRRADERVPDLLATPAAVRFVSAEPLLGAIDFTALPSASGIGRYLDALSDAGAKDSDVPHKLDWVIVGGESGKTARPMHPDWARSIRDQCQDAGVPFFFKQWGEWKPIGRVLNAMLSERDDVILNPWGSTISPRSFRAALPGDLGESYKRGYVMRRRGKKRAGRLLDGREWNEMPGERSTPSGHLPAGQSEGAPT